MLKRVKQIAQRAAAWPFVILDWLFEFPDQRAH